MLEYYKEAECDNKAKIKKIYGINNGYGPGLESADLRVGSRFSSE